VDAVRERGRSETRLKNKEEREEKEDATSRLKQRRKVDIAMLRDCGGGVWHPTALFHSPFDYLSIRFPASIAACDTMVLVLIMLRFSVAQQTIGRGFWPSWALGSAPSADTRTSRPAHG
jgi:hypothetical protein